MGLFDGILSFLGNERTNSANAAMQNNANAFNENQAVLNREWQTNMSNTAYQRATADMKAAGLNPMLAYSQGGASSPSGSQAVAAGTHPQTNSIAQGIASAVQGAQLDNTEAQTDQTKALTDKTKAETDQVEADTRLKNQQIEESASNILRNTSSAGNLDQQTKNLQAAIPQITAMIDKARAEITNINEDTKLKGAQTSNTKQDTAKKGAETTNIAQDTKLKNAQTVLTEVQQKLANGTITLQEAQTRVENAVHTLKMAQVPEANNAADLARTTPGVFMQNLNKMLRGK